MKHNTLHTVNILRELISSHVCVVPPTESEMSSQDFTKYFMSGCYDAPVLETKTAIRKLHQTIIRDDIFFSVQSLQ